MGGVGDVGGRTSGPRPGSSFSSSAHASLIKHCSHYVLFVSLDMCAIPAAVAEVQLALQSGLQLLLVVEARWVYDPADLLKCFRTLDAQLRKVGNGNWVSR